MILIAAIFVPETVAAAMAAGETLPETASHLEHILGIVPDQKAALSDRIATMERRVFGFPQDGALMVRLDRLKQSIEHPGEHPSGSLSEQGNIDDSLPSLSTATAFADSMPLLNAIPPNFLRMDAPSADPSAASGADYLPVVITASKGKVLRFKTMPIPVLINNFPDRNFITAVVRGFENWEDRTNGAVRFVQVDDPTKARIQVVWKRLGRGQDETGCMLGAHTITKFTQNSKAGMTTITVSGVPVPVPKFGPKYIVPPQIIEVNLDLIMSKNPAIRYRLLQNVVTHELGHALGLLGHSSNVNDMMYSVTDEHSRLSQRDINTLIKLYERKADVAL